MLVLSVLPPSLPCERILLYFILAALHHYTLLFTSLIPVYVLVTFLICLLSFTVLKMRALYLFHFGSNLIGINCKHGALCDLPSCDLNMKKSYGCRKRLVA